MTNKEFATALASVFRKRALSLGLKEGREPPALAAIASAIGELADDIETLANSIRDEPKPVRKEWEYLT